MLPGNTFLEIADLDVFYGGIHALHSVSLQVKQGEIACVIGANGAGKSTLLKTIAGVKEYKSGDVRLEGKTLPKQSHRVVREGVMLVPEGRRIFAPLSVRDNLRLGAYSVTDRGVIPARMNEVFDLFPVLKDRLNQPGGTLSGGEQQMLAVGRALMAGPRLLLLDEPSLGLAPMVIDTLFETFVRLNRERGLTILLVEQNASLALEMSNHSFVLETGQIKIEGVGPELLDDPRVRASYLGVKQGSIE
ncbi:MAG: ABC transporter ATP-binding protein [Anaerolineaceae bacterium]|nr:ABC transporter ATP-binding protein [Anaerolineaceae bacterium]